MVRPHLLYVRKLLFCFNILWIRESLEINFNLDSSQIYGAPPSLEDNNENDEFDNNGSFSAKEAYGAPADGVPIEEGYGSPTNNEEEVLDINENYGSPLSIKPIVDDSGKEVDTLYNAPPIEADMKIGLGIMWFWNRTKLDWETSVHLLINED